MYHFIVQFTACSLQSK